MLLKVKVRNPRRFRTFSWSGRLDLNQRPFGPEPNALPSCATPRNGANEGTRTPDLLITNQLLYRLSYVGNVCCRRHPDPIHYREARHIRQAFSCGARGRKPLDSPVPVYARPAPLFAPRERSGANYVFTFDVQPSILNLSGHMRI